MPVVRVSETLFNADRPIQGADRIVQHAQGALVDLQGRVAAWAAAPEALVNLITGDTLRLWCVDGSDWADLVSAQTSAFTGTPVILSGLPVPGGSALRVTNADYAEAAEDGTYDADLATVGGTVITLFRSAAPATGWLTKLRGSGGTAARSLLSGVRHKDGSFEPSANDGTSGSFADISLLETGADRFGAGLPSTTWWIAVHQWEHGATTAWSYWAAPMDRSRAPVYRAGSYTLTGDTCTDNRVWSVGGDGCDGDVALIHVMTATADWRAAVDQIRAHMLPWLTGLQHAHAGVDGISPGESHGWTPLGNYETCSAVAVATSNRTCSIRCSASGDAQVWVTPLDGPGGFSGRPFAINTFDGSGTDDWNITLSPGRWLVQAQGPSGVWSIRT